MTARDYKPEPPEQIEPEELVGRRTLPTTTPQLPPQQQQQLRPPSSPPDDNIETERENSPASSVKNLRVCKSPPTERDKDCIKRPSSVENASPTPAQSECGASDMSIHNNSNNLVAPVICNRLPSPLNCEPVPGPSNMPPVQQVPLVKKIQQRY